MLLAEHMKYFISATTCDLGEYRNELTRYLHKLRIDVEVQDEFQTDYRTIHELLVAKIKSCDAVICLVGEVFGGAPSDQQWDPPQSYTQLEYHIARELGKPVYLFFPKPDCPLQGSGEDSQQQRQWQQDYRATLRQEDHIWYEFSSASELHECVAQAIPDLAELARLSDSERGVWLQFPTPLAKLFAGSIKGGKDELTVLGGETLRFLALLATHDALLHGIFAADSAEEIEQLELLQHFMEDSDWRQLLRLSCPECPQRFVPQFVDWERRQAQCLDRLLELLQEVARRRGRSGDVVQRLRQSILDVYEALEFLERFVFVAVRKIDEADRTVDVQVLCGQRPTKLTLGLAAEAPIPTVKSVYLLRLDQRQAMSLQPAFWYWPTASQNDLWGMLELTLDLDQQRGQSKVAPFSEQSEVELDVVPPSVADKDSAESTLAFDQLPDTWRKSGIWGGTRSDAREDSVASPAFALLDDQSWDILHRTVLPESEADRIVGGRFQIVGQAFHRGRNADVYCAVQETGELPDGSNSQQQTPTQHAVHLLRDDVIKRPVVRTWFASRALRWRQIDHPCVLNLNKHCQPEVDRTRPFLATDQIAGRRTLASDIANGRRLTSDEINRVLRLAAEVCLIAHQQDLRVLSFPLRHFLIDANEKIWLTGFDTLVSADGGDWKKEPTPLDYFRGISKDADSLAPELSRPLLRLPENIDVFALGALLSCLRGLVLQSRHWLPLESWSDPWECLTFHCLAIAPELRLQSIDQFLRLIEEPLGCCSPLGYPLSEVLNDDSRTKMSAVVGKYLVTNSLYHTFCQSRDHPLPVHLRNLHREDHLYSRLAGPWCPVVFVHLDDAEDFARWFSHETGRIWRLPREAEWEHVATGGDEREYPWGDEPPCPGLANYDRHYRGSTVVGAFDRGRSPTGCFDLSGNVWEWCTDRCFDGAPKRVLKGGAYDFSVDTLRASNRDAAVVLARTPYIGFRLISEGSH